ncbi:MAG: hypothetical protein IJL92_03980 [Thermoguttaceae bacterium]|nr:hypothetical protein [Thermoguttaceae bacterium]
MTTCQRRGVLLLFLSLTFLISSAGAFASDADEALAELEAACSVPDGKSGEEYMKAIRRIEETWRKLLTAEPPVEKEKLDAVRVKALAARDVLMRKIADSEDLELKQRAFAYYMLVGGYFERRDVGALEAELEAVKAREGEDPIKRLAMVQNFLNDARFAVAIDKAKKARDPAILKAFVDQLLADAANNVETLRIAPGFLERIGKIEPEIGVKGFDQLLTSIPKRTDVDEEQRANLVAVCKTKRVLVLAAASIARRHNGGEKERLYNSLKEEAKNDPALAAYLEKTKALEHDPYPPAHLDWLPEPEPRAAVEAPAPTANVQNGKDGADRD